MPAEPIPHDRAVVDRVVDGATAVLLIGPEETEAHVDVSTLPDDTRDGTWLVVDPTASPVQVLGVDRQLTEDRASEIATRMDRLRQERHGGRFNH